MSPLDVESHGVLCSQGRQKAHGAHLNTVAATSILEELISKSYTGPEGRALGRAGHGSLTQSEETLGGAVQLQGSPPSHSP